MGCFCFAQPGTAEGGPAGVEKKELASSLARKQAGLSVDGEGAADGEALIGTAVGAPDNSETVDPQRASSQRTSQADEGLGVASSEPIQQQSADGGSLNAAASVVPLAAGPPADAAAATQGGSEQAVPAEGSSSEQQEGSGADRAAAGSAAEDAAAAGRAATADGEQAALTDAASSSRLIDSSGSGMDRGVPSASGSAAPAASERASSGGGRASSSGGEAIQDESSQAALLPATDDPSHFSLKQPKLSRLSSLLSACTTGRTVDDSGETYSRAEPAQQQEQQQQQDAQQQGWPPELDFDSAAAELVLLPRSKLLPLARAEQALADAAGMLGRQEAPVLLAALLTLRRVAIHHPALLADSMEDVVQVLLEGVHGGNPAVCQASLMALLDLMFSFGSALLRHLDHGGAGLPQYSCLLGLLTAASRGRTPGIRFWANEALRFMAERMHQGRVIRAFERFLDHELSHVRAKASEWLMVATYRRPDSPAGGSRPASPGKVWQS